MRSYISEKSLEMNVNENLVNEIRRWGGIFSKVFIYGFTLREEAYHGFDSSLNLPGSASFLFSLQYKKPVSKSKGVYRFQINTNGRQHLTLLISRLFFENIWYTFPLFINTHELSQHSPNFLNRTFFANIVDFPRHTFDRNVHKVEINPRSHSALVFSSEAVSLKIYSGEEFLEKIKKEIKPIRIEEIKKKKLMWEDIYAKLSDLNVKKDVVDSIRRKEGKLRQRFTSGFFSRGI